MKRKRNAIVTLLVACTIFFSGCIANPGTPVATISPDSPTISINQTQQFTVTIPGVTVAGGLTWIVNGIPGGNATFGKISATGFYTAPATVPTPNFFGVGVQYSQDNGTTLYGTTTVTIVGGTTTPPLTPGANISVSPSTIQNGGSATLTWSGENVSSCEVNNQPSVNGVAVATGGSVSVAPSQTTTYTLSCTGPNGPATSTTTLAVQSSAPPPSSGILISPSTATVESSGVLSLVAMPQGNSPCGAVTWEASYSSAPYVASQGSFDATYTAPAINQDTNVEVAAVCTNDPTVFGTAEILVTPSSDAGASQNPAVASVYPEMVYLAPGGQVALFASVSPPAGTDESTQPTAQSFAWSLQTSEPASLEGTITPRSANDTSSAIYTASSNVASLVTVTVAATSTQYNGAVAYVIIQIDPSN